MGRLAFVFFLVAALCGVAVVGEGDAAHGSTAVHVSLSSNWAFTSLFSEASEFVASESPSQFWDFVGRIGQALSDTRASQQLITDSSSMDTVLEIGEDLFSEQNSFLNMSLSVRYYSPRVAMHYQVAEQAWQMAKKSPSCPTIQPDTWVLIIQSNTAACIPEDALLKDADCDFGEDNDPSLWIPEELENVFPNKDQKPALILYADLESPSFLDYFKFLKKTEVPFALRYTLDENARTAEYRPAFIQGYGVRLDLKNMEYKAVDDTQLEGEAEDNEENLVQEVDPNEETHGFYFGVLSKRFPEAAPQLSMLRESLKELDISPDQSVDYFQNIKPWEVKQLPLWIAQRVLKSANPLDVILDTTQNLPSYALALSKTRVDKQTEQIVDKMLSESPSIGGSSSLILNGQSHTSESLNPFTFMSTLGAELKRSNILRMLGFSTEKQQEILLWPKLTPTLGSVRFDIRSKAVQFIHSLSDFPNIDVSMSSLSEVKPGGMVYCSRNLVTMVIAGDPTSESFITLISGVFQQYQTRYMPVRIGIAFRQETKDAETLAAAFNFFMDQTKQTPQALQALIALSRYSGDELEEALTQNRMSGDYIRNWAKSQPKPRKAARAAAAFFKKIGNDDPATSSVFVNGIPVMYGPGHFERAWEVASAEFGYLKNLYEDSTINDSMDKVSGVYDYLLTRSDVATNVPAFLWKPSPYPDVMSLVKATSAYIPSPIFSIWGQPMYLSSPEALVKQVTYALVFDFSSSESIRIVRDILDITGICSPALPSSPPHDITDYGCLQNDDSAVSSRVTFISATGADDGSKLIVNSIRSVIESQPMEAALQFVRVMLSTLLETGTDTFTKDGVAALLKGMMDESNLVDGDEFISALSRRAYRGAIISSIITQKQREDEFLRLLDLGEKGALLSSAGVMISLDNELTRSGISLVHQMTVETTSELYADFNAGNEEFTLIWREDADQLTDEFFMLCSFLALKGADTPIATPSSALYIPPKTQQEEEGPEAIHKMVLIVDPLSSEGHKVVKFAEWVRTYYPSIHTSLVLNPSKAPDHPSKSYYQYVLNPPMYDRGGFLSRKTGASFDGLPDEKLLTVEVEAHTSWMIQPIRAAYDLDNLKLSDIKERQMFAEYQIVSLSLEGACIEGAIGPPQGLELYLGDKVNEHVHDTIVMLQYGYFQLQATPGIWQLSLAEGKARSVYDIVEGKEKKKSQKAVVAEYIGEWHSLNVAKKEGMEDISLLTTAEEDLAESELSEESFFESLFGPTPTDPVVVSANETIHVFSVASGHLYERFLKIMILSVMKNTNNPVKFWFVGNFLSPQVKEVLPVMAEQHNFEFELVSYQWPLWLNGQTEKQRRIWGYKILFLDVLFPLDVNKVIFVDADQIVRADLVDLVNIDLEGAVYGFVPFCKSRPEMDGFRFWKGGFWEKHLAGRPYHISALFVVDLKKFRSKFAGDRLRTTYEQLSQDPGSLANLDQDLPNYMQNSLPIFSLPQDWLWCETWCSDASKETAKTIDLCNNPLTKAPKLENAVRIVSEWTSLDEEAKAVSVLPS